MKGKQYGPSYREPSCLGCHFLYKGEVQRNGGGLDKGNFCCHPEVIERGSGYVVWYLCNLDREPTPIKCPCESPF